MNATDPYMTMSMRYQVDTVELIHEELRVPAGPGIELHVRNKRPAGVSNFGPTRTIVLVHGATFSSGSLYDVPFDGRSFLDFLACEGYEVFALDVRGYGRSTRPPEMEAAPELSPPAIGTETGVFDFGKVVEHVLAARNLERVCLFGMSWGGTVAGAYATRRPGHVEKLIVLAPQWLSDAPIPIDTGGPLGAYRLVPVREAKARWLGTAPERGRASLVPPGWFEKWADFTLSEDDWSRERTPDRMRASNGPIQDIRDYWRACRPFYDPADIRAPVLLIHGEWDVDVPIDLAQRYFLSLTGAAYRQWIEIGEATHLVLLEKNRLLAFNAVRDFLENSFGQGGR